MAARSDPRRSACSRRRAGRCAARLRTRTPSTPAASPRYAISGSSRATRRSRLATRIFLKHLRRVEPGAVAGARDVRRAGGGGLHASRADARTRGVGGAGPIRRRRWCSCSASSTTAPRAGRSRSRRCATSTPTPSAMGHGRSGRSAAPLVDDQDAAFLAESMRLGKVIAEMHLALAAGTPGTAMAPAPLTDAVAQQLGEHDDRRARCSCSRATSRRSIRSVTCATRCRRALRPDPRAPAGRTADPHPR